jgi:superoxide reductase
MKENVKFYICPICGNVIELIQDSGVPVVCCGKKMELMQANTSDAALEKHVPIYEFVEDEIVVRVGEIEHPMQKDHYIMWIALVSDNRISRVTLYPEQETLTRFKYAPNSTIYAYCNKHGLWKTEVK